MAKRLPADPKRLHRTARALLDMTLTEAAENHGDNIMEHLEKRLTDVTEPKEGPNH